MTADPAVRHVLLVLGSNIDKERNIVRAVQLFKEAITVTAVSSVYETAPLGNPNQPTYFNVAILVQTSLSPEVIKQTVITPIEQRLGRLRTADKNAPRTIDIDIAFYGDEVRRVGEREIPDPEILRQPHLTVPLAEVAPEFRHPLDGRTLKEIAEGLFGRDTVRRRPDVVLPI